MCLIFFFVSLKKKRKMTNDSDKRKHFIDQLDIYIVSHGGVGTNYLVDYLETKGLKIKFIPQKNGEKMTLYHECCHAPSKIVREKPCLYVCGDIPNAILSQHERKLLEVNANKMVLGKDILDNNLERYIKEHPLDPLGIYRQMEGFVNTPNTVVLQYPYTRESLAKALEQFGFSVDLQDFKIKQRRSCFTSLDTLSPHLQKIIKPYLDWKSKLNALQQQQDR